VQQSCFGVRCEQAADQIERHQFEVEIMRLGHQSVGASILQIESPFRKNHIADTGVIQPFWNLTIQRKAS
jgi:hypothetical protein